MRLYFPQYDKWIESDINRGDWVQIHELFLYDLFDKSVSARQVDKIILRKNDIYDYYKEVWLI